MKNDLGPIDLSMFEVFTDASMHTVVIINEHGIIQTVSRPMKQDFGYTQEELAGQNVSCMMPSDYANANDGYLGKIVKPATGRSLASAVKSSGSTRTAHSFPCPWMSASFSSTGARFSLAVSATQFIEQAAPPGKPANPIDICE